MALYHYSEDPAIERFVPRAPKTHPMAEPGVWAIDEWHSPLYFCPSDCPRVCFWPLPTTTEEDRKSWWTDDQTRMVIAIEHAWVPRFLETTIYRYEVPEDTFIDCEDHGVYLSRDAVVPIRVEKLRPSVEALGAASVELRMLPSLVALGQELMKTSLHWSLIRMRYANGWNRSPGSPTMPK